MQNIILFHVIILIIYFTEVKHCWLKSDQHNKALIQPPAHTPQGPWGFPPMELVSHIHS